MPRIRIVTFIAGLLAIEIALQSIVERYDTTLFSVHMVQHLLLTLIAPPLLALGAPVTLLLRVSRPGFRRRFLLPILHSRVASVLSFPVFTWFFFAAVMWATHFSPIFERSLEDPGVHDAEHALYLDGRDPLLVAGGRPRPEPVADVPPGPDALHRASRCPRTRSSPSSSSTRRCPCTPTTRT